MNGTESNKSSHTVSTTTTVRAELTCSYKIKPISKIPRNYIHVLNTMLSSQNKWNTVFEHFIERIDELEPLINPQ